MYVCIMYILCTYVDDKEFIEFLGIVFNVKLDKVANGKL